MSWLRRPAPPASPTCLTQTDPDESAVENAWLIHAAITNWTANVDQKASFSIAIESAVLVAAAGFTKKGSLFGSLKHCDEVLTYATGMGLLLVAVICAGNVVKPRLKGRATAQQWPGNFIYFGHLRHWTPSALAGELRSTPILPVLAAQLVVMSDIAWRKHRFVQVSMWLALAGFVSLGLSAWVSR